MDEPDLLCRTVNEKWPPGGAGGVLEVREGGLLGTTHRRLSGLMEPLLVDRGQLCEVERGADGIELHSGEGVELAVPGTLSGGVKNRLPDQLVAKSVVAAG